jgi:uncharacterized protein (TIGR00251 family)
MHPFRRDADGILVSLRVTPNASADRIEGTEQRDDGTAVLRIRVTAVPDRGKANAAVIALLAKALGIPKSSITLVSGVTARLKTVHLSGDPAALEAALARHT